MTHEKNNFNFDQIRRRLAESEGPAFWRSFEELSGTPEFREAVQREFPAMAGEWADGVTRRGMLKLMGASLAMLGLSGCFYKQPQGTIVPYVKAPDEIVPGQPIYFATAMPLNGYGRGVLAVSREGRPIKIEGNPDHPASLGAADIYMQAAVLDLYDPDRSRNARVAGQTSSWGDFLSALQARLEKKKDGRGIALLTGTITSPTLIAQIQEFQKRYPQAKWHQFDPLATADAENIFEEQISTTYDLRGVETIVTIASDLFYNDPASLRYARQFIDGRRVRDDHKEMNRLYSIEYTMTVTGSMADHHLALRPSQIGPFVQALAHKLGVQESSASNIAAENLHWIETIATELSKAGAGKSLVVAGPNQPQSVQALVHAINQKLGNIGKSVRYLQPVEATGARSLKELVEEMNAGTVDTLLILGGNPAYAAPVDLSFADALEKMSKRMNGGEYMTLTAHLSSHYDETSYRCQWHIPRAHWLESWGDIRAFDGTASIVQPLIAPLYGGRSDWEFMESLLGRPDRQGIEIIQTHWRTQVGDSNFEAWWLNVLQKGLIPGSDFKPREAPRIRQAAFTPPPATQQSGYEIAFDPDPNVRDGEFTNNAWLQELPKPFTKLTWDNAILISIRTAEKLGGQRGSLRDGDIVRVNYRGRNLAAPVVLLPGQADDLIVLHLGYGRTRGGQVMLDDEFPPGQGTPVIQTDAPPRGYNAYLLRTSDAPSFSSGAEVTSLETSAFLAITRNHHAMSIHSDVPGVSPWLKPEVIAQPGDSQMDLAVQNRNIVRTATLDHFKKDPEFVDKLEPQKKPLLSLYPGWDYSHGLQWGMTIDQTACIGCNACVIACQAENNIPVVGKREVGRQREMHWIRIDDYFAGPLDSPTVYHQPVPCMHCENAPCEYVCPVGATTHSDEGINEMTYNRCIGTRYCSNNCPYKVRRFNFFLFTDAMLPNSKLLYNPEVTVRSRGVMEKCTYCIQRIDRTRMQMEEEVLALEQQAKRADSEEERQRLITQAQERGRQIVRTLQTACQQSCPTEAIIFGDIRDPGSDVSKTKAQSLNYSLLTELTTKPRTTYLARLTNPNPALSPTTQPAGEHS